MGFSAEKLYAVRITGSQAPPANQRPNENEALLYFDTDLGSLVAIDDDGSSVLTGSVASPAFTGVPTTPTAAALTNNTQVASTAYADLAVGVETTRATAAEAVLTTAAAAKPLLKNASGSSPAAGDNHVAAGVATLASGTVTITLTSTSVFSALGKYVVAVSYQGAVGTTTVTTTAQGLLTVTNSSGSAFVISNGDATDSTSKVVWHAVGIA